MTVVLDADRVLADLQEICRDIFENQSLVLSETTTAADVPKWDSFNHLNVIVAVEQRFGVRFRTSEIEGLRNVGDFVAAVLARSGR